MATEPRARRWPTFVGYPLFFLFALVVSFFITFPYEQLTTTVKNEADKAGYFVRIGNLGPGFLAVRATDVELSKKAIGDELPEPVKLDSVSVGPTLIPPGIGVNIKAFGGTASVRVSGMSKMRLKVDADELDVSKGNLKAYSGVDMTGSVGAHVDVTMPRVAGSSEPDLSQAAGTLSLQTKALTVNGGTVNVVLPQFGRDPTPLDLPKIIFGDIDGAVKLEKGVGTIEEFKSKSPNIEFNASGSVRLAKRFEYSEPNIELRFKADPEFQKGLGMVGMALSVAGPDPKDPSWRLGRLTGSFSRPRFP